MASRFSKDDPARSRRWKATSRRDLLTLYLALPRPERDLQFLDTAQAAELAGVSRRTIQAWAKSGLIGTVRVGKGYRILVSSLAERFETRFGE